MASISFDNLKPVSKSVNDYTYVDLHLDIQEEPIGFSGNFRDIPGQGRDIRVSFDIKAIQNSLKNLFNTYPGERFLLPDYGSDIRRYIFDPISDTQGRLIGREVYNSITRWEPRVEVVNIDVRGYRDDQEYEIDIVIRVPFLTEPLNLGAQLNREGFVFQS